MNVNLQILICLGLVVLCSTVTPSYAIESHRSDRYTLHSLIASPSQNDLLSAVIQTEFPPHIGTVGSAVDYILLRSGYRHITTPSAVTAMSLPLPQSHRSIGPL